MAVVPQISVMLVVLFLTAQPPGEENKTDVPTAGARKVVVEGVASGSQATPIAVLREIGERLLGRPFSVLYGKYVALGEESIPTPLDTKRKKILSIEKLNTGLFKAVIEVETPMETGSLEEKLRERTQRGYGELRAAGSSLLAREKARLDAMEKAILSAVAERYPGDSAPARLAGRVFFLGTIREEIEGENYSILARVKVRLMKP